jgi:mannose-6-phosphate isomerase
MASLASAHPSDKGLMFGLLMHHVALGHGEAVFVDAGVVHAYIQGFGLEVMLPSDNVVRAGLSAKHTDADEFLALATCKPVDRPPVVDPVDDGSVSHYSGFRAPFVVRRLTSGGSVLLGHTSAVIVSEDAQGEVSGAVSSHSATQGDVVFVSEDEQEISFRGEGSLWVVSAKISQV